MLLSFVHGPIDTYILLVVVASLFILFQPRFHCWYYFEKEKKNKSYCACMGQNPRPGRERGVKEKTPTSQPGNVAMEVERFLLCRAGYWGETPVTCHTLTTLCRMAVQLDHFANK